MAGWTHAGRRDVGLLRGRVSGSARRDGSLHGTLTALGTPRPGDARPANLSGPGGAPLGRPRTPPGPRARLMWGRPSKPAVQYRSATGPSDAARGRPRRPVPK